MLAPWRRLIAFGALCNTKTNGLLIGATAMGGV